MCPRCDYDPGSKIGAGWADAHRPVKVTYFPSKFPPHITAGPSNNQHCGASAQTRAPPPCLFGLGGRCTPWIQLIHPHPIVKTRPCDWSNTMRTCITLTMTGKLTWVYIGGTSRWNHNSRTLLLIRSGRSELSIYNEGSANDVSLDLTFSLNLHVIVGDLMSLGFVGFSGLRLGYNRSCDYKPTH